MLGIACIQLFAVVVPAITYVAKPKQSAMVLVSQFESNVLAQPEYHVDGNYMTTSINLEAIGMTSLMIGWVTLHVALAGARRRVVKSPDRWTHSLLPSYPAILCNFAKRKIHGNGVRSECNLVYKPF